MVFQNGIWLIWSPFLVYICWIQAWIGGFWFLHFLFHFSLWRFRLFVTFFSTYFYSSQFFCLAKSKDNVIKGNGRLDIIKALLLSSSTFWVVSLYAKRHECGFCHEWVSCRSMLQIVQQFYQLCRTIVIQSNYSKTGIRLLLSFQPV